MMAIMAAECAFCPVQAPVQAIGYCVYCNRPFCMSHQGYRNGFALVDMCAVCADQPTQGDIQRQQEQQGEAFIRGGAAARMLTDARVGTVELLKVTNTVESRSFGRARTVENVERLGHAWLLGEHMWEYNDGGGWGGCDVKENRATLLQGTGPVMTWEDRPRGGYRVHSGGKGPDCFRGRYRDLYERIHRLAGRKPA
jgi:hypothetical protein